MDKNKNNVDDRFEVIVNICSVILPFTTLPQLYIIYIENNVSGVSAFTWFAYAILTIPIFIYSIKRKELPLILLNGLWIVVDLAVAIGVLIYS